MRLTFFTTSVSRASMAAGRYPRLAGLTAYHCLVRQLKVQECPMNARHNSQHRVILLPEVPNDTAKTNPILEPYNGGIPDLSKVTASNSYFGVGKAMLEFESAVCLAEELCLNGERDFDKIFGPVEAFRCQFESVWNSANLLQLATDNLDRDQYSILHRRAERAFLSHLSSRPIFEALRDIKGKHAERGGGLLDADQERIVDRYLAEFKSKGFELPPKEFQEHNSQWLKKLKQSQKDYDFRMMRSTERFRHQIKSPLAVQDFPVDVLKAMAVDSSQPTKGPWTVTLHPYVYKQTMAYCSDRAVRWNAHQADVTRGAKSADSYTQVASCVSDIRQHRSDQAISLGYANFAEMSLATKMAATVENVHTMIASLLGRAKQHQEIELESLQTYAEARGFDETIQVYDVEYFKRKQRRSLLGRSDDELRDFFPLPVVLKGIFKITESMFGVRFEQMEGFKAGWHPDVTMFRVLDAEAKGQDCSRELGQIFLDPYVRDDKGYGGGDKGWYVPIRPFSGRAGCRSLGALIMSLPAPNFGKPSLLNFFEVRELLGKFGSVLAHMCAQKTQWAELSSRRGVEWDVIDLPRLFMSFWLQIPEVLRSLTGHWSTGEPLDVETCRNLCQVPQQHLAGYHLCQELLKAAFDLAFYTEDYEGESYQDLVARLHPQYLLLPQVKGDSFPLYFREMFTGEDAGGIYSTIWAKMLASDAFSAVLEARYGGPPPSSPIFEDEAIRKVTFRFRNTFLAGGSSVASAEVFRQFRGRDPSHEALLMSYGLKSAPWKKIVGSQEVGAASSESHS